MLEFLCWFKGAMKVAIIGVKMHNQMRMVRPMYFSAKINNLQIAHMYIEPPPPRQFTVQKKLDQNCTRVWDGGWGKDTYGYADYMDLF